MPVVDLLLAEFGNRFGLGFHFLLRFGGEDSSAGVSGREGMYFSSHRARSSSETIGETSLVDGFGEADFFALDEYRKPI